MTTASNANSRMPRAGRGRERRARAVEEPGQRHGAEGDRHRHAVDVAVVDAHQLRGRGIVGGGAEGAADRRAREEQLQPSEHHDGDDRT